MLFFFRRAIPGRRLKQFCPKRLLRVSGGARILIMSSSKDLRALSQFANKVDAMSFEKMKKITIRTRGVTVLIVARKSKENSKRLGDKALTFTSQVADCKALIKQVCTKPVVPEPIKLNESGVLCRRPGLLQALRSCSTKRAVILFSKACRMTRNVSIFDCISMSEAPFYIAEYPTIDYRTATFAERAAILRDVVQGHIDGRRVSSHTKPAMALLKKKGVLMGGNAHNAGADAIKAAALVEAKRIRPILVRFLKKNRPCAVSAIVEHFEKEGLNDDKGVVFTDKKLRRHLALLNICTKKTKNDGGYIIYIYIIYSL